MKKSLQIILGLIACAAIFWGVQQLQSQSFKTTAESESGAAQVQGRFDVKNSPYFAAPDFYNMQPNENLLLLTKFKTRQQITGYTCGPAAAAMVVEHFLGNVPHGEMEMAKIMATNNINGTSIKGMVNYFKEIGWQVSSSLDKDNLQDYYAFQDFVQNNLRENTPIIVENVDWGGHYRVIIGYDTMGTKDIDDDVLILADPFDLADHKQDGYNIANAQKFYYMWFDAQLFKSSERQRPWVVAKPK